MIESRSRRSELKKKSKRLYRWGTTLEVFVTYTLEERLDRKDSNSGEDREDAIHRLRSVSELRCISKEQ